uniref:Uncharacterized protein n=1 Tax=Arundo donax TaxID=35708 RepID=A0A0A9AGV2_ARUDO
MSAWWGCRGR